MPQNHTVDAGIEAILLKPMMSKEEGEKNHLSLEGSCITHVKQAINLSLLLTSALLYSWCNHDNI